MNAFKLIPMAMLTAVIMDPSLAFADDDTGLYVGMAVNRLSADFADETDVNFDDSDNAASVKIGYMFNDYLGLEVGYLDLGDYLAEGDTPSNRIELNADARSVAVIGNWSVRDELDLYIKGGLYNIDVESTSVIAGNVIGINSDENEVFGAFGVEFDLGHGNIFAEISVADTDVNDLSINIASAGFKYEF